MIKHIKTFVKLSIFFILFSIACIFIADITIENYVSGKVYDSTTTIPHNKVGLVLGTSKILSNGRINLYYKYRIDATVELFNANKIDFILISGDNSNKDYDEPSTFKNDLVVEGIPADKIYLDYAGFRTLDSIVRSKEIFGQNTITIISQEFHNKRAIYIAKHKQIKAVGFNAKNVTVYFGLKTQLREKLARVKMLLDLIFGKKPKFLGDSIEIK